MSTVPDKHVLFTGSDEFRVVAGAKEWLARHAPDDAMNLEVIDGRAENVEMARAQLGRLKEALLTLPFFGGRKVVHFREATSLQDTPSGRSEAVAETWLEVAELLQKLPPEEVSCVISAPGADKRRAFYKRFEKFGHTEVRDLPDLRGEREMAAWVREVGRMLKAAGLHPDEGVAERLVELLGNQTRALVNEIEKLVLYVHPHQRVTEEDLRSIAAAGREVLVWDLCDAVTEGRAGDAAAALRQLLAQGESEVGILILLGQQVRLAALGRWLQEKKWLRLSTRGSFVNVELSPQAEDLLPTGKSGAKPNPYRLARVVNLAQGRPAAAWLEAVEEIYQAYQKMLGAVGDRQRFLETVVVRLARARV